MYADDEKMGVDKGRQSGQGARSPACTALVWKLQLDVGSKAASLTESSWDSSQWVI
jgi:hypothetical protein